MHPDRALFFSESLIMNPSFHEFENRLRELLEEKQYLRIINLIDDEGERYPDQRTYLVYWQVGMAARDNNPDLAFQYLDELIEEGIWISQYLLRTSPSLETLQDFPEYEERILAMAALQRLEAVQLLPLLTLRQNDEIGPGKDPYPLLLGLHQDRDTALASIRFWQPAAEAGWLVGVPQSTQALWSGAYVWEDIAQAQREVADHTRDLIEKYTIDTSRIILAGHRQGGEVAAWLPCSGGLDVRGFIAIAPTGSLVATPDRWFHSLQASEPRGLRGAIISGDVGMPYLPELKRLVDILNAFEVPTKLDILEGVGTEYDPAYNEAIRQAIDFVLS
jgi:predicted esterase